MWKALIAVFCGAGLGALLRWWLAHQLNQHFPPIALGTLAANLLGGYVVGLAIAFFATTPSLSAEWRLLVITGFCGGLTTFSTYSAELATLLEEGRVLWAFGVAAAHLFGSVVLTFAGIGTWTWLRA